ncbi:MAG: TIGR02646 family protein [Methyloprofundus sp.]|nr:TIGR02646 family protein [Methyloprofundus sp.]
MRKIDKGIEPIELTEWKRSNPAGTYNDLSHIERKAIRFDCLREQFYLCAYCCQAINENNCMNEHVEARNIAPHRSLDFLNIVASCTTNRQCDKAHGSQALPLTPLMMACETEFKFKISGRVEGLTERAKKSIQVLNLGDTRQNNRSLIEKRKQLSDALLLTNGIDPAEGVDDDELLEMLIDDIKCPKEGKLEGFSPVAVNILQSWLNADYYAKNQ